MKTLLLTAAVLATFGLAPALAASTAPPTDPTNAHPTRALANSGRTNGTAAAMPMHHKKRPHKVAMHKMHRKPMKKMPKAM